MSPYVLRWEAGDFLFHRYEKPFWKDIDSEEVLEVGDVAKKLNSLEAQVEALKDKLGNAEFRIVKLEGNLQNSRDIAKLASGTSSIIKICDALLERMVSNETEREDWTTRGGRR